MPDDFYKSEVFKNLRADIREIRKRLRSLENTVFGNGSKVKNADELPKWYRDASFISFLRLVVLAIIVSVVGYVIIAKDINMLEVLL